MRQARNPKLFGSSYTVPARSNGQSPLNRSWRSIIIVVLCLVALLLLGRLPVWRLKTVELLGDKNSAVEKELNSLLGQSIFSAVVSRLIDRTQNSLIVADFDCRRGLPATLRCTLKLRTAQIIWRTGEALYLVDRRGVPFAPQTTAEPELVSIEDTQQQPVKLGTVIASPEIIKQYQRLVELLKARQLTVKTLQLNESLYQVTAVVEREGKQPIKGLFLLSGDISSQVEIFAGTLASKGESITERIDVRVPGYVYTK